MSVCILLVPATRKHTADLSERKMTTYGGQGIVKPGVDPVHHAIVYAGKMAPDPSPEECKRGKMRTSIRVLLDRKGDRLYPLERIDFGRIYTFEHNVRAKAIGWIHPKSHRQFDIERAAVYESIHSVSQINASTGGKDATPPGEEDSRNTETSDAEDSIRERGLHHDWSDYGGRVSTDVHQGTHRKPSILAQNKGTQRMHLQQGREEKK